MQYELIMTPEQDAFHHTAIKKIFQKAIDKIELRKQLIDENDFQFSPFTFPILIRSTGMVSRIRKLWSPESIKTNSTIISLLSTQKR